LDLYRKIAYALVGSIGAGLAMQRREFVTLIGGAALLPLSVRAQQPDRIYRIGVLTLGANGELGTQQRAVFTKALMELGWTEGKNIQIDQRWAANDVAQIPALARELLSLKPDVILVQGTPTVATLQRETKTTPIIFVSVTDPVPASTGKPLSADCYRRKFRELFSHARHTSK
jgi:putative ABC transport system substrate-binding protein